MDLRYLKLAVFLTFVERMWSFPLACSYNGTSYEDGESVTTEDPCLSCACRRSALECSVRVCGDHPDLLPNGCYLVYKPNECCPQVLCEGENDHVDGVVIRTAHEPVAKLRGNGCVVNGSTYAEGSAVGGSQVCEYCYCFESEVKCIKPQCLQSLEGCRPVYEKSSCCPAYYDCRNADIDAIKIQMKNLGMGDVGVSSRSFANESVSTEESTTTEMTEPTTIESTTAEPDLTTSFQLIETETATEVIETTTSSTEDATENSTQVESLEEMETSIASRDKNRANSSQATDDYDSYDYSEPKLPPSLPNLVIFPFVAADAVVKDETTELSDFSDSYEKPEIKRIDVQPVFYKDYFSPPAKTEGGFLPKPFYDYGYFDHQQQIESPNPTSSYETTQNIHTLQKITERLVPETSIVDARIKNNEERPTPHPLLVLRPETETSDFLTDSTPFYQTQATKKPVTVTYKNLVVDFYPNYLITTAKNHFNIETVENLLTESRTGAEEESQRPTLSPETATTKSDLHANFFAEFLDSFLSETTTVSSVKLKYSSKIKSQATVKPTRETGKPLNVTRQPLEEKNEKPEVGSHQSALLKLAGCNIYGMMYRVGKLIAELSGPCSQCLCTDFGVQCTSLKC